MQCCGEMFFQVLQGSVVGKCCVEKCCREVLWRSVVVKCCREVLAVVFLVVVAGTFAFRFVGCCFDVLSPLFFQESHHFAFFGSSVKLGDLKAACIVQVHAYVCNTQVSQVWSLLGHFWNWKIYSHTETLANINFHTFHVNIVSVTELFDHPRKYSYTRLGIDYCFGSVQAQAMSGNMFWHGLVLWSMCKPCRFGSVQAMSGKMLWNGSVLWSMRTPCRRCGARRVAAAVKRPRRGKQSAAALSLLLVLPLLGMAVVAPCAAAVLLAPLFLASVLCCWQLNITFCPWQAWFCRQCLSGDIFILSDGCFIQKIFFCFLLFQAMLWQAVKSLGIWHPLWRQEVGFRVLRSHLLPSLTSFFMFTAV